MGASLARVRKSARKAEGAARTVRNRAGMDSLVLIERLDELMAEAKPIPFTREARVDRDEVYKILDRIRTTLPVEFERLRWMGKEAEQEEGLENKLREINEAIVELRRAQREQADDASGQPLTAAASEQVREIIEAAERTAASVEREANAEAKRLREEAAATLRGAKAEAQRHLRETRERAAAEAADYLRRVEEATEKMLERANSAGTEIDGMLTRLRGSGGSVIEELEAIMSGLTEIEVRRAKPAAPAKTPSAAPEGERRAPRRPPAGTTTRVARMPAGARRAQPPTPQFDPPREFQPVGAGAASEEGPRPRAAAPSRPAAPAESAAPASEAAPQADRPGSPPQAPAAPAGRAPREAAPPAAQG